MNKHRSVPLALMAGILMTLGLPNVSGAATNQAVAKQLKAYVSSNGLSCMGCHGIENKVMGPAWIDVSKKFKGDPNEIPMLTGRIHNGGSGTWGAMPMPPNLATTPQAKELAKMISALYTK